MTTTELLIVLLISALFIVALCAIVLEERTEI